MNGPASFKRSAVLAAVNTAFRAACRGGLAASVDRRCAQRSSWMQAGTKKRPFSQTKKRHDGARP